MSKHKKEVNQEEVLEDIRQDETTETTTEEKTEETVLKSQYDELNDKFVRLAAEYDNFRKRSLREREAVHSEAVSHAVKALLPTFDNLERALKAETKDAEFKKGVEMTMTQLMDSLKSIGVEMIVSDIGTQFDPNFHNAVMHVENEELGENVIAEVFQQGFKVGDKVIRHAMVQVAN